MWSKYGAQVHLGEEEHVQHKWECDKNMCTNKQINKQTNNENNKKKNTNESTESDQKSKTSQERKTALTSQY